MRTAEIVAEQFGVSRDEQDALSDERDELEKVLGSKARLKTMIKKELLADADAAETAGDYGQAAVLLERALRIQPRDPELLQSMAEVQLQMKDYEQALSFAVQSYDSGPRVGEICSRNWRTIGVARERLGDHAGSAEAVARLRERKRRPTKPLVNTSPRPCRDDVVGPRNSTAERCLTRPGRRPWRRHSPRGRCPF